MDKMTIRHPRTKEARYVVEGDRVEDKTKKNPSIIFIGVHRFSAISGKMVCSHCQRELEDVVQEFIAINKESQ